MSARSRRPLWLAIIAVASAACGSSSPASPETFNLTLTPGEYIFGASVLDIPASCGGLVLTNQDVQMSSRVTLTKEGTDWVARSSASSDGSLEVRFRGSGGILVNSSAQVGGTIRGTVHHKDNGTSTIQKSMAIPWMGDSFTFSGFANDTGITLLGMTQPSFVYSRTANGTTVSCPMRTSIWVVERP